MKPSLLVLAAGMGSRYGGLKQIDPVGPSGETIMDYSIYDALRAGFGKVVFVIRRDIEKAFREAVGGRFERRAEVRYVFQELDMLSPGFVVPAARKKPWGTGHAILVAEDALREPFAVINGDDFYGSESFRVLADHLALLKDASSTDYAMVGFLLRKTVSDFGTVARGICQIGPRGLLEDVVEWTKIQRQGEGAEAVDEAGHPHRFTGDEVVSMNMWGLAPSIFAPFRRQFEEFLRGPGREEKAEFFIPTVVNRLIREGAATVKVLSTPDAWLGITYQEDRPKVAAGIRQLVARGMYPAKLAGC